MFCFEGSYQIKMAKSYITEHLHRSTLNHDQLEFVVELCNEHDDLIRVRFQSRHSTQKKYTATVQFDETKLQPIEGWYCTCASGAREVGMCCHVTALLWHMGVEGTMIRTSTHPRSADKLFAAIDNSMHFSDDETDSDDENGSFIVPDRRAQMDEHTDSD
jgi:hypothetical protein